MIEDSNRKANRYTGPVKSEKTPYFLQNEGTVFGKRLLPIQPGGREQGAGFGLHGWDYKGRIMK